MAKKKNYCPKCGKREAVFNSVVEFRGYAVDDIYRWPDPARMERWIHFDCPKSKTPNFVFFLDGYAKQKPAHSAGPVSRGRKPLGGVIHPTPGPAGAEAR